MKLLAVRRIALPVYECNLCHMRYPIMPYYPAAAPHGPDKQCRAPLGWTIMKEEPSRDL